MLDSDLAMLYQVETKVLNQAVKRNIARFPEKFRFQLTEIELLNLKSQFVTSSLQEDALRSQFVTSKGKGGRRYFPYAFTEQGIAMLSAVLRSDVAIQVSIQIMDTFVAMRRFIASNALMFEKINELEVKQWEFRKSTDERFDKIFQYISEQEEISQKIFFAGQIYDAFSLLISLVMKAEEKILLVDNYVAIETLNILAKKKSDVAVTIYTSKKTRLSDIDIINFNKQYPSLEVRYTEEFHDRFLIIDNTQIYHIGASIKDAGKKCFGINVIEDRKAIKDIIEYIITQAEVKKEALPL
ncbi:MAG: ORF6N domain-containing protein [Lachnospiraceae bacterium]|nr:ORF6N domain-containing protein [Lachnospiraceae bacterium]